eukprot:6643093-Pyramimonas_sp.AAC.1
MKKRVTIGGGRPTGPEGHHAVRNNNYNYGSGEHTRPPSRSNHQMTDLSMCSFLVVGGSERAR